MREAIKRRVRRAASSTMGEMPFVPGTHASRVLIPRPETEVLVDVALKGVDAATPKRRRRSARA